MSSPHPPSPVFVLVVDDDESCCVALRSLLGSEGFEVEVASSAAAALARMETRRPDLVLSDVRMPEMDGFALLREVRARDDVPVILMSGDGILEDDVLGAGAAAYVGKPIDIDDLTLAIDRALAVRHEAAPASPGTRRLPGP